MNSEEFAIVFKNLRKLMIDSVDIVNKAGSKEKLEAIPLKEVIQLTDKARNIVSRQDKVLKNEVYHILGMGDLTPSQEMVFVKTIQTIGRTRSFVKAIASYKIPPIPGIPAESSYECSVLGVKLKVKDWLDNGQ